MTGTSSKLGDALGRRGLLALDNAERAAYLFVNLACCVSTASERTR
jgi:hypothetical protein